MSKLGLVSFMTLDRSVAIVTLSYRDVFAAAGVRGSFLFVRQRRRPEERVVFTQIADLGRQIRQIIRTFYLTAVAYSPMGGVHAWFRN